MALSFGVARPNHIREGLPLVNAQPNKDLLPGPFLFCLRKSGKKCTPLTCPQDSDEETQLAERPLQLGEAIPEARKLPVTTTSMPSTPGGRATQKSCLRRDFQFWPQGRGVFQ